MVGACVSGRVILCGCREGWPWCGFLTLLSKEPCAVLCGFRTQLKELKSVVRNGTCAN